jgi:hypothetical protein
MTNTYLERRESRLAFHALKREIIFGMVISTMLLGIGAWRYYVVIDATDALWGPIAVLGALGLLLAVVFPSFWRGPEKALSFVLRKVGGVLFTVLLTVIYAGLVSPVGWALRRIKGADPIYAWEGASPAGMEGWHPKEVLFEANVGRRGKPSLARRFVNVLQFFVRRGHFVFLPTLVILLALGMVLFFVKSSALAPFIYTLF